jgi:hypothetical protein
MARSILPKGSGSTRRGFEALIRDIAEYYPKAYEEAYVQEIEILIKDIIDHTPIDTGAAAGVTSNRVGSQKRPMYAGHKAAGSPISNLPGGSGWQLEVEQRKNLKMSIVNPQWNSYLKFLEYGIVQPIAPAESHFVYHAWQRHLSRRDKIRERIRRGRS